MNSQESEITINLWQEKLITDYKKRKIGEVVVRKEVATRWRKVQIPLRREKIIVEQVAPTHKILAEIDLEDESNNSETEEKVSVHPVVKQEFTSPKMASDWLAAIAANSSTQYQQVRVEILGENID